MKTDRSLAVVLWMSLLTLAGCAQSNGDINRVQPNVLRKSELLDGQWFFRNTVTYTPFNTQFTFPGQTGTMEKLVFEIQQGFLVGYRAYPYILGSDPAVEPSSRVSGTTARVCDASGECRGGQPYYGAPVVAFPIVTHLDIQRSYNPSTGEPTNVIVENTTDRPWNEREFIRVNWAANVLNRNSGLTFGTIGNASGGSSSSTWIQPNEPGSDPYDWPVFEYEDRDDDGDTELTYFDVTGKHFANPDTVTIRGWGQVPTCWLVSGVYDCSSAQINVRSSFARVDPTWARDYEPLVYDNELMALFGVFRTERLNYDRKFGFTESAVVRLANRHRVWKQSYRIEDGDVTSTAIPLAERQPRPIVYYLTPASRLGSQASYDEYYEPSRTLESEYDRAFRRAIAAAQGKTPDQVPQMFFVCNNPVKEGDPRACGRPGLAPRVGDVRYSFINTVTEPVANGLLGYGPSSADPETGQILSAMSNTYTWGIDLYGRRVTEWILLLAGERTVNEYISGQAVRDYLERNPAYTLEKLHAQATTIKAELQVATVSGEESTSVWSRPSGRLAELTRRVNGDRRLIAASSDAMATAARKLAEHPAAEAAVLDNPDLQADLVNLVPPFLRAEAATDPAALRSAARGVLVNPRQARDYERARIEALSSNNITTFDFTDRALAGVALQKLNYRGERVAALVGGGHPRCAAGTSCTEVEAKAIADDEIARQVRQSIWLANQLHEVGHTVNLRHNFQGSFDSLNYFDQYWDIRKDTLTVEQAGQPRLPRTPQDLKAAAEGTETQRLIGLHDFEYSSIMDYSGKVYGDWAGLGKYDEAALLFAYSGGSEPGYVEVFDTARATSQGFPGSDGKTLTVSGAAADLPMVNATYTGPTVRNYTERFHYSLVPLHFGEGPTLQAALDSGLVRMRTRRLVPYAQVKADEARVRQALAADPALLDEPDRAAGVLGPTLLRVPYMFCGDESADGPVLSCQRFDRGPDYHEQVRAELEDYWNYYIDTHFRRDRAFFSGNGAMNSAFGTFLKVGNNYKHWVYELLKDATPSQEQRTRYRLDPTFKDTWTLSVIDGINQTLSVMSMPPDGLYMYRELTSGPRWDVVASGDDFDPVNQQGRAELERYYTDEFGADDFVPVPRGVGRRMFSRYDFRSGYNFFDRMLEAGHYNDQVGAMFAAVDPVFELQGADLTADQDRYNIPYSLVFRDELYDTFSALWTQDELRLRPTLYKTINNANQVEDRPRVFWRTFVKGGTLFEGLAYPRELPAPCGPGENPGGVNPPRCFAAGQNPAPANIQVTYTSRIYGLFLGMALFSVNFDLDYSKQNQVFKLGGAESFTVAPGFHTVELNDPVAGHRFVAIEKDGAPPNSTGAIRMVNNARDYLTMVNDPATCPVPDFLFSQGFGCLPGDQVGNPAVIEERRQYWTEQYSYAIRDLELQRSMYSIYGKAF